jgi:hypothetical protein
MGTVSVAPRLGAAMTHAARAQQRIINRICRDMSCLHAAIAMSVNMPDWGSA